ncbi:MAG TPA: hypothetical protein VIR04_06155 [Paralcaligenes sp.]
MQVAFYKGRSRIFNRLVAWWTRGAFSHCELVTGYTSDGAAICWSSSWLDGGVRRKAIKLNPDHWELVDIPDTPRTRTGAVTWFMVNSGQPYDLLGLLGFLWRPTRDVLHGWFCSEAIAAALGIPEPWRFDPNTLRAVLLAHIGK